jgi:hypothetical protein
MFAPARASSGGGGAPQPPQPLARGMHPLTLQLRPWAAESAFRAAQNDRLAWVAIAGILLGTVFCFFYTIMLPPIMRVTGVFMLFTEARASCGHAASDSSRRADAAGPSGHRRPQLSPLFATHDAASAPAASAARRLGPHC